ncbi:MAG: DUF2189 domain-containing protein, partial [Rhodoferax sp.]|nr:DUF2189 domain-containing protein [Rhodoferax sp.]MCB2028966.1 DUF2189 domain-containing protein [Rhodoferax sp.]MCB2040988.1 DUF2189 domain-containing protein [Rhodoferax sp.]
MTAVPPDPAPNANAAVAIRTVPLLAPLHWLALGWRDLVRGGWLSLLHGAALAVFGLLLLLVGHQKFWLLAGAFSGFLVVAPVLATSLYAISRALAHGRSVR